MNYKRIVFMLVIFIFLFSVSGAYAGDVADAAVASEDTGIELTTTQNDVKTIENEQAINETDNSEILSASNDGETVVAKKDSNVLRATEGTYATLASEIVSGGDYIELVNDRYTYYGPMPTISITHTCVIDGRGAVIDMAGSNIQTFSVKADGVVFKNLTITNAHYDRYAAGIYFEQSGALINCNFRNNTAKESDGGAVYFQGKGEITNCSFIDNTANRGGAIYMNSGSVENCNFTNNNASGDGGAVHFRGDCEITNCNFTGNTASGDGGAVYFWNTGTVSNCNFTDNKATGTSSWGGAILFGGTGTVTNCNFTNNTAGSTGGAVHFDSDGNVTNCNFTNNTAYQRAGAVYFLDKSTVSNCNFANNKADGSNNAWGGAIWMDTSGSVTNCNFTDNSAYKGGAVCILETGSVANCNFVDNKATGDSSYGGAIYIYSGTVTNCNFTGNTASGDGGAIWIFSGTVSNCNFTDNKATGTSSWGGAILFGDGGAVYFVSDGTVTNCNFTNNTAGSTGGAVYFDSDGNVTNCNFANNKADGSNNAWGGAIWMDTSGSVANCNFVDNKATGDSSYGGAVCILETGSVANCNFVDNKATGTSSWGGAILFGGTGTVTNCNFVDNKATGTSSLGGAISFGGTGTVTNCNFTGNNATTGSAIYFYKWYSSDTLTVSDSTFLNNRANAGALDIVKTENNITITFTGQNNLLNAIYSRNDAEVTFNNVKYWGANGITTVSSTMSESNKAAGQNITVGVVVNGKVVLNEVKVTDDNGMIVLPIIAGENYYISARHDTDSYYTEAEKTITNNTKFNVNVTSKTTNNKTVNITAKSNIYSEFMPGKLLFILPNGDEIDATYGGNGTWWTVHTFDEYSVYQVNASYIGLDNVTLTNGTITINKADSKITLETITLNYGESKNITITTKGATGITAKIDNVNVDVVNNFTVWISGLNVGYHTLAVSTVPDEDHISVTETATIIVNKYPTEIIPYNETLDLKAMDIGHVSAILTPAGIGNLTYVSSDVSVATVDDKGNVKAIGGGNATITVSYAGNDIYAAAKDAVVTIAVSKLDTAINVNVSVDENNVVITATVDSSASGFIKFNISGKSVYVDVNDSEAEYDLILPVGNYTVEATYMGDNKFNSNRISKEFTVADPVKENTPINLTVSSVENIATFTVNVDSDATGIVRFEISGAEEYSLYSDVLNGKAVLEYGLEVGDYTVVATYMGDARFNSNVTSENFNIKGHVKKDTPISANVNVNGYRVIVTVEVNETATGFVNMKFADTEFNVAVDNGVGSLTVDLPANSYNMDVTYLGDDNFNENMAKVIFTVLDPIKENTTIGLDVSSIENNATFTVNLNPDATGIVKFEVTGAEEYTVYADVLNGKAVMEDVLAVGDYEVVATYIGDTRFNSNITSARFTITGHVKKDTPISADAKVNGNLVTITVNVDESATGFVGLKLADSTIYVAVENGVATYVNKFEEGSYNVEVTYMGDDDFNENSTRLLFTVVRVAKENTTISLDVSSIEDNATFTVNVNPDATGIVKFEVTGAEEYTVYADVVNGKAVMEDVLSVGDYTVVATYMGDARFNSNVTSENFNIKAHVKKDTPISADVVVNGYKVTVNVMVNETATGFVNMKFADTEFNVAVDNGVGSLTVDLPANSYNVDVTYLGDDNFNENKTKITFTVVDPVKENTTIELDVSSVEDNATFTVNVDSGATGIVKFEVSGAEEYTVYADVLNGKAVMNDVLSVGDYTVVATYLGDDRFNSNVTSGSFTIAGHVKKDTPISADAKVVGNRVTITVNVDENATGFVGLKLAGSTIYAVVENGVAKYISTFDAGSYNMDVAYLGDDDFNENSTKVLFTVVGVVKEDTPISLNVSSVEDYATFTVNVNPYATGVVRFVVSGPEEYTVYADVLNGKAIMEDVLEVGDYEVVATYMGDDKFNSNVTSGSFTISGHVKKDTPISADAKVVGNRVTITVNVDENATGFVGLKLTDSTIYVALDKGMTSYVNTFEVGSYNIEVTYTGDDNYNENNTKVLFTVVDADKENTTIGLSVVSVEDYVTFTVNVNPDATGIVKFEVTGAEKYTVYADVINGKAVMEDVLSVGDYTVVATYMGDDNFNSNTTLASFNVEKEPVIIPIASEFSDITIGDDLSINIVLKDETGNVIANAPITYVINGTAGTTTTAADGSFTIKAVNGAKVEIKYAGNETILPTNLTLTFNVPVVPPVVVKTDTHFNISGNAITINGYAVDTKAGEKGIPYATELLDANGKPIEGAKIQFGVNNKIYKRTTNENGSFTPYNLDMIRAGRYTMAFSFGGDDNYNSTFAVVCVDLDKKPITIKASAKTYKTSTKTKQYTITLKTIVGSSADGKVYLKSGKKVTLQVNGKTFSGKTNSKGQVTFKITNLNKKAKYKAKISYAGDITYEAATKTVTLTVK